MPPNRQERPHWQVDRHVPLALIFCIVTLFVGQTVAGAMWVANVSGRLDAVEKKVERLDAAMGPIVERSIRLEARLDSLIEGQARMENILRNSILSYMPPAPPAGAEPRPMVPARSR